MLACCLYTSTVTTNSYLTPSMEPDIKTKIYSWKIDKFLMFNNYYVALVICIGSSHIDDSVLFCYGQSVMVFGYDM